MRAFAQGNTEWTAEDPRWKIVESCWENICKNHFLVCTPIDHSWKKAASAAIKWYQGKPQATDYLTFRQLSNNS